MFIVKNHIRTEMQLMSFSKNGRTWEDSVLHDCVLGFWQRAHQKVLSNTRNFETAKTSW